MTTIDVLPFTDNKDSDPLYQFIKELIELKHEVTCARDQTDCLQKSIAALRKDLISSRTNTSRDKDRSFWIHW